MRWGVFSFDDSVHIMPMPAGAKCVRDTGHTPLESCWCCPAVERHARLLVVHRGFDN